MTGVIKFVAGVSLLVALLASGRALADGTLLLAQAQDPQGDMARGQALFASKGACLECHRIGTRGSRFGPDLTDIGARAGITTVTRGGGAPPARGEPRGGGGAPDPTEADRARTELERALLDPGADILPPNRTVRLVMRDGEAITARVLNQDTFSFQLIDTKERLLTVQKSELREFTWIKSSSMPSYRDKLTAAERADLIAYLLSLKGINK